jgi:hypothetical protein
MGGRTNLMAERSPRMLDVARSLVEGTHARRVQWEPHTSLPGQFDTAVAGSILSVASLDAEGSHPFSLVVWERFDPSETTSAVEDTEWIALEKVSTSDVMVGAAEGWERLLAQLWRVARTQALGIDERLDALLRELSSDR